MAGERAQNLQDTFLNHVRKNKIPLTIFLVNGVKLQGVVTWFDNFCVLLRRDGHSQLVYKHAISTIMPSVPIDARQFGASGEGAKKQRLLQDVFLSSIRNAGVQVEFDGNLGYAKAAAGPGSEKIGILVAVLVLAVAFGSLVAMSLPIVVALVALFIGLRLYSVLGERTGHEQQPILRPAESDARASAPVAAPPDPD